MEKPLWMWIVFSVVVVALLILDLGLFYKKDHEIEVRESLQLSGFYIAVALIFGIWIWYGSDFQNMEEYLSGYLIEKSLSLDNIFVISLIFSHFQIPRIYQHRVLFWGIIGVIVLRGIMISLGAKMVAEYAWILYIFAIFLILTGVKMLFTSKTQHLNLSKNWLLNIIKRYLRVIPELYGNSFFIRKINQKTGIRQTWCTPLFIALITIESADAIFAIDSVPAIFAITTDTYIVFTSNIFAILGLRALYFALAAVLHRFSYLKYALALVLIFVGSKIFIADFFGWIKFPTIISLSVTVGLIAGGIFFSLYKTRRNL